jgi:hypothetical protein
VQDVVEALGLAVASSLIALAIGTIPLLIFH